MTQPYFLLYIHSILKIQAFYPILSLMDFMVGAFYRLFLWAFKKENINCFL